MVASVGGLVVASRDLLLCSGTSISTAPLASVVVAEIAYRVSDCIRDLDGLRPDDAYVAP